MTRYILLISAMSFTFFAGAQNVGIGTPTPAAKLDIIGSVKITDGTQGANKILTSGANGLATWATPPAPACFFFGTDQSVGNNDFIGMGTSAASFSRTTSVVPFNCQLSSVIFSTRALTTNQLITATVWVQPLNGLAQATSLSATIFDGSIVYTGIATGAVLLQTGDLISVRLSWSAGGALFSGAAVSVTYK